jgi:uncharacterized protein YhbP (UPF0306 family)
MSKLTDILEANEYAVLTTVTDEGGPWAVPIRFAYDEQAIYWRSPATAEHSRHIARDGRVALVIFDSKQQPGVGTQGAVYLHSSAMKLEADDFTAGMQVYANRFNDVDKLGTDSPLYRAVIGTPNTSKSVGPMLYYEHKGTQE